MSFSKAGFEGWILFVFGGVHNSINTYMYIYIIWVWWHDSLKLISCTVLREWFLAFRFDLKIGGPATFPAILMLGSSDELVLPNSFASFKVCRIER